MEADHGPEQGGHPRHAQLRPQAPAIRANWRQGRRALYLYDATDPLSAMWARVRSEQRGRKFISRSDARAALNEQGG